MGWHVSEKAPFIGIQDGTSGWWLLQSVKPKQGSSFAL